MSQILPWVVVAAAVGLGVVSALYLGHPTLPETRLDVVTPATDEWLLIRLVAGRAANCLRGIGRWAEALVGATAAFDIRATVTGPPKVRSALSGRDSKSLGFFADYKLRRIDLGGEQPQILATVASNGLLSRCRRRHAV